MADAIRVLAMDAVERAQSGHPGMPMGMADVATVLYSGFLKFNPKDPTWFDRDRFILSAGHGSMLLYALNYLTGYDQMTLEQLKNFRQLGSLTAGHPEYHPELGIETTTGPLGQGLGMATGMALGEAILRVRSGEDLVDHHTYVIAGDGCLMEGLSHEAISLAGHLQLGKLIVLFDDNHITIDGSTDISSSEDTLKRFDAAGWQIQQIDGHDHQAIFEALTRAREEETQPSLIACRTTIAYGSPHKGGTSSAHGSPLGTEEIQAVRAELGWDAPAFKVPEEILKNWRSVADRNLPYYKKWQENYLASDFDFKALVGGEIPVNWKGELFNLIEEFTKTAPQKATRQSSGKVLEILTDELDGLMGGSADLSGSNNTKTIYSTDITPLDYSGNYINYGVREHGMAATMNGLALHGGFIPYGGTFLVFSDYARPAIRLSALMKQRVVYVMTHDSIGLGEDGPTHQPIEHLASLRAIPNLNVFRPADAVEVAECWMKALESKETPSIMALSRQSVPTLRHTYCFGENLSANGAYVIKAAKNSKACDNCIIATGTEVSLALEAQKVLEAAGINVRVVSMPCRDLFEQQSEDYISKTLGGCQHTFVIEAAAPFGWEKYATSSKHIFGIDTFGASAPAGDLYAHFGLTPHAIAEKIQLILEQKGQ